MGALAEEFAVMVFASALPDTRVQIVHRLNPALTHAAAMEYATRANANVLTVTLEMTVQSSFKSPPLRFAPEIASVVESV